MTSGKKTLLTAGVDIGGTKVRAGLVDEQYRVVSLCEKLPVRDFQDADGLIEATLAEINGLLTGHPGAQLRGIGIGSPGPLAPDHRSVAFTPNTPILQNFPLVERFEEAAGIPVRMNNDANVFVLGEALAGAGAGHEYVYGITLGTGYGHGFVWDGKVLNGAHGAGTEYGIAPFGESTFEEYVSGRGLVRHYRTITGEDREGIEIFEAARQGDPDALAAWGMLGRSIAQSLIYVMHLLDPDIIIVGGSLAAGFDFFIDALRDELDPYLFETQRGRLEIVPAALGDSAAIVGAAALI